MKREAYVVVARWPLDRLTCTGKLTRCISCGTYDHMGIYFPNCNDREVELHSGKDVAHDSARHGTNDVTFDFLSCKLPRFQSARNLKYWSEDCTIHIFPIKNVSFEALHALCIDVARENPYNNSLFRCNRLLFCGCLPFHLFSSSSKIVGQSHCAALSVRIIAAARSGTTSPLYDDDEACAVLGIDNVGFCQKRLLTAYSPGQLLNLMKNPSMPGRTSVLGFRRDGFLHQHKNVLPRINIALS